MMMNALSINLSSKTHSINKINYKKSLGALDLALKVHNKKMTYDKDALSPANVLCLGGGPIIGVKLPGLYRLTFIAKSPLTKSLFTSTIGGGAVELYKAGLEFISIEGRALKPSVIVIKNKSGKITLKVETVSSELINKGTTNLLKSLLNKYSKEFNNLSWRILVAGPAAFNTNMGVIKSVVIKNNKFEWGAEGVAGSGGLGSVMAQAHNITAIIYGGNTDDKVFKKNLKDAGYLNELFNKVFGKQMSLMITDSVKKYYYDKDLDTGGTFGVNMKTLGSKLPMLNWSSVNETKEDRTKAYDRLIKNNYLKQWHEEIIVPKSFKTCGEACPAMCKKVYKKYKKDYEPYEACGPNAGVFDQRHAEALEGVIEELGYGAIETGNIISLLLEAVSKGLIDKSLIGLKEDINYDIKSVSLNDSLNHAIAGVKIIKGILKGLKPLDVFRHGIRVGIRKLKDEHNIDLSSIANYIPFGDEGCIAPPQYWVPGFYVPLPMMGKFLTYYGQEFRAPKELGRMASERFIYELYAENTGLCRFHRGWAEKLIPLLINEGLGLEVDYYTHCKNLFQELINYSKKAQAYPVIFETRRTKELIANYLKESLIEQGDNPELKKWVNEFDKDLDNAVLKYFNETMKGVMEVIKL